MRIVHLEDKGVKVSSVEWAEFEKRCEEQGCDVEIIGDGVNASIKKITKDGETWGGCSFIGDQTMNCKVNCDYMYPEGPATEDEHYERLNSYHRKADSEKYHAEWMFGRRWEITDEIYDYFLGLLPPLDMATNWFVMSEFTTRNITQEYSIEDGKFFCEYIKVE